jgi:hypothetical protein
MQRAILSLVAVLSLALAASSCAKTPTSDIHVHSAADAKTNFKGYKTYTWYGTMGVLRDQTGTWMPRDRDTVAELKFLIDKKMRELGLAEAKEVADLQVGMLIVADVQQLEQIQAERAQEVTGFEPVGKGALVVELIDNDTGKTVWMGGAEGEARGSYTVEQSNERLAYAIDKLFDELPR